jgi:hypothetical protein
MENSLVVLLLNIHCEITNQIYIGNTKIGSL